MNKTGFEVQCNTNAEYNTFRDYLVKKNTLSVFTSLYKEGCYYGSDGGWNSTPYTQGMWDGYEVLTFEEFERMYLNPAPKKFNHYVVRTTTAEGANEVKVFINKIVGATVFSAGTVYGEHFWRVNISTKAYGASNDVSPYTTGCYKNVEHIFNTIEEWRNYISPEFVLPEKWAVIRTPENYIEVNKYFNKIYSTNNFTSDGIFQDLDKKDYMHNPKVMNRTINGRLELGYTLLSNEQFNSQILNNTKMSSISGSSISSWAVPAVAKEVVGYKLEKTGYKIAANAIAPGLDWSGDTVTILGSPNSIRSLQAAGVLNLWFSPIYKEEKKVITIGSPAFDVEIEGENIKASKWKTNTTKTELRRFIASHQSVMPTTSVFGTNNVTMKSAIFHIGCQEGPDVTLEELKSLLDK